jgi:hypothetical protein
MTKRIVLAGLLGGIAMFVWASLAHMVLGLGSVGIQQIPNERAVLGAMQTALGQNHGLYMFPALGPEGMAGYQAKLDANPSGLVIYHPPGVKAMEPRQLIVEFLTEVIEALLAVFLLSRTALVGFGARVGFIAVIGVLAALATNVSYWNWYGFPGSYTAVYMILQFVNFVVVGLVAVPLMKPKA